MPMESSPPGVGSGLRNESGLGPAGWQSKHQEAFGGHASIPQGFPELPGEGSLVRGWTSHSQVNWRNKIMNISETLQKREAGTLRVAREN